MTIYMLHCRREVLINSVCYIQKIISFHVKILFIVNILTSLTFIFQSQHSHEHSQQHADHERSESRGEADPLSPTTVASKSPKKVGINFSDSPTVISSSAFDNPAARFDLENEEQAAKVCIYGFYVSLVFNKIRI